MSQQPPTDRPFTFVGTGGRDPRQPFGAPVTGVRRADDSGQVPVGQAPTPPRRWAPLVVTLASLLAVGLGLWGASRYLPDPAATSTPTPTPTPSASAPATPGTVTTGLKDSVPFTNNRDQSQGTFTITSHQWTPSGLVLRVRVHLDQGSQAVRFFCLDNTSARDYSPSAGVTDQLEGRPVQAGETVEGTVAFDKPRGDTTVFLAGSDGKQVAALVVTG